MQRDLYIDTIRGICVIAIIFIHTVFWSGLEYTPGWIRNLVLFIDVPLFFFLTGCTMAVNVNLNPLKQTFRLVCLFFFAVLVCRIIFLDFNLRSIIAPLFLGGASVPQLKVIQGSYWFVPIYCAGVIWAKMMIDYLKDYVINIFFVLVPVFYCYLYFIDNKFSSPEVFSGISIQMFLFPLWLILLGYKTYNSDKKLIWRILAFVFFVIIVFLALSKEHFYLQSYKFPISLPYIIASLISLCLVMGFKTQVKNNLFVDIGQKALYFYLAQGISSSVLYFIVDAVILDWPLKLLLCFSLNCSMTILIGRLISEIEPKILSVITK